MIDVFQAKDIAKAYGKRRVVDGVSIEVAPGEVVGLLGPNGAGKTTVFYMMVGLVLPDSGCIQLRDHDVTLEPLYRRARAGVGYLPQEHSLFSRLTVSSNIQMALEARGLEGSELRSRLESLLEQFGLQKVQNSLAAALSGGERRRVEIARCLAIDPRFVLLDEPFAGIDPIAVSEIKQHVRTLRSQGIGVLITDHNVRETLGACDRAYLMRDGKVFLSGSPQQIANDREARQYYLGDDFKLE